jgi:hypothetical protein
VDKSIKVYFVQCCTTTGSSFGAHSFAKVSREKIHSVLIHPVFNTPLLHGVSTATLFGPVHGSLLHIMLIALHKRNISDPWLAWSAFGGCGALLPGSVVVGNKHTHCCTATCATCRTHPFVGRSRAAYSLHAVTCPEKIWATRVFPKFRNHSHRAPVPRPPTIAPRKFNGPRVLFYFFRI